MVNVQICFSDDPTSNLAEKDRTMISEKRVILKRLFVLRNDYEGLYEGNINHF